MKDFDNFLSWSEIEAKHFSKFRKYPHFDNDYLWANNDELLSCGISFTVLIIIMGLVTY